jgi:YD repeat-containing protein
VVTDALGHATRHEYDAAGRLVKTIDPLGQVTLNEYNDNDNVIRVTRNYRAGQPQNDQNEYNLVSEYAYDPLNQPLVITGTLGRETRREYDNGSRVVRQVVNYVDGVYDPAQPDEDIVTQYSYDGNSNVVSVIDTLGRETRTEYDDLNRVIRQVVNYTDGVYDPAQPDEDIVTRYQYDGAGNHVSTTDTLGREVRAGYDDLDRLEQTIVNYQNGIYDPDQPDQDLVTRYGYGGEQIAADHRWRYHRLFV